MVVEFIYSTYTHRYSLPYVLKSIYETLYNIDYLYSIFLFFTMSYASNIRSTYQKDHEEILLYTLIFWWRKNPKLGFRKPSLVYVYVCNICEYFCLHKKDKNIFSP